MDSPQILWHHLLQEYLVERDINFISVNLRCLLQMFSWVMYWQAVGGKLSRAVYLAPPPRFSERMDNLQILLHHLLQEYLVERDINFTEMLTSNVQLGCTLTRGGGQAVQGSLSCPPPHPPGQIFKEKGYSANFINPSTTGIFSWNGYKLYFSQSEMLTSIVQLGFVLTRGGGASCPGQFILPPAQNFK